MSPKVRKFIQSWLINTLAVLVAVYVVKGIHFRDNNFLIPFAVSLLLGVLNAFIRPILILLALPLVLFTLGLFMFVINALLLYFVGVLLKPWGFYVDSFGAAFWGALIISIVAVILNAITGNKREETQSGRRPPPDGQGPGGSGPVIDV